MGGGAHLIELLRPFGTPLDSGFPPIGCPFIGPSCSVPIFSGAPHPDEFTLSCLVAFRPFTGLQACVRRSFHSQMGSRVNVSPCDKKKNCTMARLIVVGTPTDIGGRGTVTYRARENLRRKHQFVDFRILFVFLIFGCKSRRGTERMRIDAAMQNIFSLSDSTGDSVCQSGTVVILVRQSGKLSFCDRKGPTNKWLPQWSSMSTIVAASLSLGISGPPRLCSAVKRFAII